MKTSVISPEFRDRYLSNPKDPEAFEGTRRSSSTGPRTITTASTIRRSSIDEHTHAVHARRRADRLSRRAPRWSTCSRPAYLIKKGVHALPCIGDGRQSGTSGSPSILNASPEAAAGGGLALLQDRRPGAHRPAARARPTS